jgi:hypothetical protein
LKRTVVIIGYGWHHISVISLHEAVDNEKNSNDINTTDVDFLFADTD